MPKYLIKLTTDEQIIAGCKAKGMYPFPKGGYLFDSDTEVTVDSIDSFSESKKSKVLDPRLTAEEIDEDSKATD